MSKHIDTLEVWFDSGETGKYKMGDTIICKGNGGYSIMVANHSSTMDPDEDSRILHRAPKPKPAWHDAVAVIAKGQAEWDHREAFTRSDDYPETRWVCNQGVTFKSEDLFDVTPLIEQKVTDEMVERYRDEEMKWRLEGAPSHPSVARHLLAAALGLDPA